MAKKRRTKIPQPTSINNGHDVAELVRDSDPENGTPVVHAVNRTQTAWDKLRHANIITQLHWQACEDFHDLWDRARLTAEIAAVDYQTMERGGGDDRDERAWQRYKEVLGYLKVPGQGVVQMLVCSDTVPDDRLIPYKQLRDILDTLAISMELAPEPSG